MTKVIDRKGKTYIGILTREWEVTSFLGHEGKIHYLNFSKSPRPPHLRQFKQEKRGKW